MSEMEGERMHFALMTRVFLGICLFFSSFPFALLFAFQSPVSLTHIKDGVCS